MSYRHIPYQQEIDKLLKNLSTDILYLCNLPLHDMDLENQQPTRLKNIYIYFMQNQLPSTVPAQIKIKPEILNYVIIYKLLLCISIHSIHMSN